MAKAPNTGSKNVGNAVTMRITTDGGMSKVKFGQVTVQGPKPSRAVVAENVKRGSESLKRAVVAVMRPGVSLRPKKGVPQFSVDANEPGVYRRRLDGRVERGHLVDGDFVVID